MADDDADDLLLQVRERGSIIYRDISKNFKVMLQQLSHGKLLVAYDL